MRKLPWVSKMIETTLKKGSFQKYSKKDNFLCKAELMGDLLKITHFQTTLCIFSLSRNEILYFEGWSETDRDILNNVLVYFGLHGEFHIKRKALAFEEACYERV